MIIFLSLFLFLCTFIFFYFTALYINIQIKFNNYHKVPYCITTTWIRPIFQSIIRCSIYLFGQNVGIWYHSYRNGRKFWQLFVLLLLRIELYLELKWNLEMTPLKHQFQPMNHTMGLNRRSTELLYNRSTCYIAGTQ